MLERKQERTPACGRSLGKWEVEASIRSSAFWEKSHINPSLKKKIPIKKVVEKWTWVGASQVIQMHHSSNCLVKWK